MLAHVALVCFVFCQMDVSGTAPTEPAGVINVQNDQCRIIFDRANGALRGIANLPLNDACLKEGNADGMPFRVYLDFTKEYELGDDPAAISKTTLQPSTCRLTGVQPEDRALTLEYEGHALAMRLHVALEEHTGVSEWTLRITNTGAEPQQILPCFPCLSGVRLGPDALGNLATVMSQGGMTGPAWQHHGGMVGNGGEMSMQWHAIWDPATRSALALLFMDPDAKAKQLVLDQPDISLRYFPPATLAPGASLDLPPVKLLVYNGDWRPAARAYRAWYDKAFKHATPPAWFGDIGGWDGRHFKKAEPGVSPVGGMLDSFRDLPRAVLHAPIDNIEYAFYSRGSMLYGTHTDGDNIVREDLGGAEALQDGIAGVHRLGLRTTLYIEGYIVHKDSDLAKSGRAERWSVMHKDGGITGGYTKQGFYHMCPGCAEWQDYLAAMAARLLRETGADGVRLDSLGFYFLPCYNPAHGHATPFGYNEWMKQLLAKVREATLAVNPEALLTTEAPVDWYGQWFHGALTQKYPRDLPLMRAAVAPYRPIAYSPGGSVWASISGLAGGRTGGGPDLETLEGNWLCARFPVREALTEGTVAHEDPKTSDPEIVTRMFQGEDGCRVIIAVRPACQDAFEWPAGSGLSTRHKSYILTARGLPRSPLRATLCDVETLAWKPLELEQNEDLVRVRLDTNWAMIVLTPPQGRDIIDFDPLPTTAAGGRVPIRLTAVTGGTEPGILPPILVQVPGMKTASPSPALPGSAAVVVPQDTLPGLYTVTVSGERAFSTRRYLKVE